jgi:hypothetical protein
MACVCVPLYLGMIASSRMLRGMVVLPRPAPRMEVHAVLAVEWAIARRGVMRVGRAYSFVICQVLPLP